MMLRFKLQTDLFSHREEAKKGRIKSIFNFNAFYFDCILINIESPWCLDMFDNCVQFVGLYSKLNYY